MSEFMRLMAIAEYLGRDFDEWVAESPNLTRLQSILRDTQAEFDRGEAKRTDPVYLEAVRKRKEREERKKQQRKNWLMDR